MNRDLDQALRHAAEPVPRRVAQPHAQNLLDRIVGTDPGAPVVPVSRGTAPVSRRRARTAVAAAVFALAAAAVFTLNSVVGADSAYASWTPDPSPLPAAEARSIIALCLTPAEAAGAVVAISEKRGRYAFVNAVTADATRTCFRDRNGAVHEPSILMGPAGAEQLGARGIELYAWPQIRTGEGYARLMAGRLGSRVTGVTITVRGDENRVVRATVRDGYFAAWYPEDARAPGATDTALRLHFSDGAPGRELDADRLLEMPVLD